MKNEHLICFLCEMKKWPIQKLLDDEFIKERKMEFYPEEEWGNGAPVCEKCDEELREYYLYK